MPEPSDAPFISQTAKVAASHQPGPLSRGAENTRLKDFVARRFFAAPLARAVSAIPPQEQLDKA